MMVMEVDENNSSLQSQLHRLGKGKKRMFQEIIQHEINYQLDRTPICKAQKIIEHAIAGDTTLHLAIKMNEKKHINALLNNGAELTIENVEDNRAVLQHSDEDEQNYQKNDCKRQDCYALQKFQGPVSHRINLVLSAHVKCNDPFGSNEISYFHAVCMLNNAETVKFFWKIGVSLINCVNVDSRILFGYPSLHLAAKYSCTDVANILIARGAHVIVQDSEGQTPLDILTSQSMAIIDWIRMGKESTYEELITKLNRNKSIIKMLLKVISNCDQLVLASSEDQLGEDSSEDQIMLASVENQLDKDKYDKKLWIEINKSLWQGYTPLPFSLYIKLVITSVQRPNTNIDTNESVVSSSSFTAECFFDENQSSWSNIWFSDNKTNLAEFHAAMKSARSFDNFMKKIDNNVGMFIPHDSPVLPGCTLLHLAIIFAVKMDYDNIIRNIFDFQNNFSTQSYNYIGVPRNMYINVIKQLLAMGANVTVPDRHGTIPQQLAIKLLGKHVFKVLINSSTLTASPSADPYYLTTLHPALHEKIVKRRSEPNTIFNTTEQQHIMDIIHQDYPRLFYQAVDKYASERNRANVTALHAACCKLDIDAVEKCLMSDDSNVRAKSTNAFWAGFTPLHFLTMKRRTYDVDKLITIARMLLSKDADVTLENSYGFTPLHQALDNIILHNISYDSKRRIELLDVLLSGHNKISVNPIDPRGISYFHIACICNKVKLVETFVETGVDVNQRIYDHSNIYKGFSPLHLAARYKNLDTIDLLLELGADIHAKNFVDNTPLHEATNFLFQTRKYGYEDNSEEVIASLIGGGADITARNSFGQTPLKILMETKVLTIDEFDLLTKNLIRVNLFYRANEVGFIGNAMMFICDIESLLESPVIKAVVNNPDKNNADSTGRTPVHNIVAMQYYSTQWNVMTHVPVSILTTAIKFFLKLGFKLDQQDKQGRTPLHISVKFWNVAGIHSLLQLGSDINIVDINGHTPVSHCLENSELDIDPTLDDKILKELFMRKKNCYDVFLKRIHKMKSEAQYISEINEKAYIKLQNKMLISYDSIKKKLKRAEKIDRQENCFNSYHLSRLLRRL